MNIQCFVVQGPNFPVPTSPASTCPSFPLRSPELIDIEAMAKDQSEILLYVIDDDTRSISSMLEATEYILLGRNVVLVVKQLKSGQKIGKR